VARDEGSGSGAPEFTQDHLRAGDADRQRVADRLRQALDEGRLTVLEYDERLRAAYAALTYGELAEVTSDLPAPAQAAPPTPVRPADARAAEAEPPTPPGGAKAYLVRQGRAWLGGAVVTNGIWAATSGFDWHHYWPGVVLPIWAAGIAAKLINGKYREDDERHGRRRNHGLSHRSDHRSLPK
jgi:uncharacterized protein DUF1707